MASRLFCRRGLGSKVHLEGKAGQPPIGSLSHHIPPPPILLPLLPHQVGRDAQEALARLRATQQQAGAAVITNSQLTASMDEEAARRGEAEELAEELQQRLSAAGEKMAQQEDMLSKVWGRGAGGGRRWLGG